MYFGTKVLIFVAIVCQTIYGKSKETGDTLVESVVPEESDSEPEEQPPSQAMEEPGADLQESQSPVEEYLKEHPEVHSIHSDINSQQKIKFAYNKFGDVISVPDNSPDAKQVPKQEKKEAPPQPQPQLQPQLQPQPQPQSQLQPQQPMVYPGYGMYGYPQSGYPPMYGYPYYNEFGFNQIPAQQQQPQDTKPASTKSSKPYGVVKVGKMDPNIPEDVQKHFKQSETEDEQLAAVVQAAEQAKANKEANSQQNSQIEGMGPHFMLKPSEKEMASNPLTQIPKQLMPYPYSMPYPPQFGSMTYLQPNQFKIDRSHMQVIPMSLPSGEVMDPNVRQKLESGDAQLDMSNALIIPMPLPEKKKKKKKRRPTEAPTIEEYPEIPEVVVKKHKKPKKKTIAHLVKTRVHQPKHSSDLAKKPTFILRARLSNLPKKNQKGKNQWWKKPVPQYCYDPIIEITECKDKKLEKRWSYNPEDERCYLYEDYCAKVKRNTFKNINQCMTTCWRPK